MRSSGRVVAMVAMLALLATSARPSTLEEQHRAVVLVPGIGGNQLEAKLSDDYHGGVLYCRTFGVSYWFRLWLNVLGLIPPFTRCFSERIRLEYNAGSKKFHNPPGIETRVPGFGSTETMEYLDPTFKFVSSYMAPLVKSLKNKGLEPQKTLFGAPYDFRYAPGPNAADVAVSYLKDLKRLIEKAYTSSGSKPVVIVAHSLGGLWVLHFLNLQSLEWRRKYVAKLVAVATPWGGSVQEMRVFASGYTEGVEFLDPLVLRHEQRSTESNLWLLPVQKVFGNRTLVVGPTRNYSALDLQAFFQDIGFPQGFTHYDTRVPQLCNNLVAPLVPVTLVFGFGVDTPEKLFYNSSSDRELRNFFSSRKLSSLFSSSDRSSDLSSFFDEQPVMEFGDGDGTINLCSLTSVVPEWESIDEQVLKVIRVHGKSHSSIIQDEDSVEEIVKEVFGTR